MKDTLKGAKDDNYKRKGRREDIEKVGRRVRDETGKKRAEGCVTVLDKAVRESTKGEWRGKGRM